MKRLRTPLVLSVSALAVAAALGAAATSAAAPASAGCPPSDAHLAASARTGALARLVPAGAQSVRLCQYHGLNPTSEADRLSGGRLIESVATTRALAADLDAIPQTTGIYSCPADTGSSIVASFRYASGPANPVTIGLTGCQLVSNGHVHRTAGVSPAGRTAIHALLAAIHPAR